MGVIDLNTLWFILITVLFIGFFFLEGFDYGVGALLPIVGKSDDERRVVLNTIGPFWDGNEVWLITAGGAIFAAFPMVYATLFSGFYLALFLILVALILRACGIEFRSKRFSLTWRKNWDIVIGVTSILNAILWGVAVANLIAGVPIDKNMDFVGNFFTLLSPFTILGGMVFGAVFLYHGSTYLMLKVGEDSVLKRVKALSPKLGLAMIVLTVIFVVYAYVSTDLFATSLPLALCAIAALLMIASVGTNIVGKYGLSFLFVALAIAFVTATVFAGLFPNIMISTLDPEFSLNIYNAASSPYTLKLMTIVAICLVPVVLLYQAWSFWVFRKRMTREDVHY